MDVNADFSQRVVLHGPQIDWTETRMKGVKRRMLDRMGAESGHATSIVSYDPESHFSAHVHSGGEEFIVLDGVFQDEHGDFPAGSYIRNPPQSSHTPGSDDGCVIFVKLWQFDPEDRNEVKVSFDQIEPVKAEGREGVSIKPLFKDDREDVRLEEWEAGQEIELQNDGGIEALVLEGDFKEGSDYIQKHSWLRIPMGGTMKATAGEKGAKVWIKTGHLRYVNKESAA